MRIRRVVPLHSSQQVPSQDGKTLQHASIVWGLALIAACGTSVEPTGLEAGPIQPAHGGTHVAATIVLNQLDVEFDGDTHADSPWGEVIVQYTGASVVLYFNLVVDGNWRIVNLPLLSRDGSGVLQTDGLSFDLGVADGTDVTSVDAVWDLTTEPLAVAPAGAAATTSVGDRDFNISSGFQRRVIDFTRPAPELVGGESDGPKATNGGFPNQQAGVNECVPAALSNSLQWMNGRYGLGLADAAISIAAMKSVVKWGAGGAPQQWWGRKRSHFKDDIETTTIPRHSLDKVFDAVAQGCDVEMRANNHVVAVTGVQKLANGNYRLDLTHDTVQGDDTQGTGAQGTQSVVWDRTSKKFSGAAWIQGQGVDLFVSECPKRRT